MLLSSCEILLFTPTRLVFVKKTNSCEQAASVQRSHVTATRPNWTAYVEVRTPETKAAAPELRSPVLCPLSAGIGRTGCFIVGSIGCQQLRETGQVDILETVCQLRLDRWVSTVLWVHDVFHIWMSNLLSLLHMEKGAAWSRPQSSTNSCTPRWPSTAPSCSSVRYPLRSVCL